MNDADATDLVDFGFREGDKVKITKSDGGNFSTGVPSVTYVITGFASDNRKMTFATTGDDTDDTTSLSYRLRSRRNNIFRIRRN